MSSDLSTICLFIGIILLFIYLVIRTVSNRVIKEIMDESVLAVSFDEIETVIEKLEKNKKNLSVKKFKKIKNILDIKLDKHG